MSVDAARSRRYEFSSEQNEVMANLGRAMRRVSLCMGTLGILSLIWGIATLFAISTPWTASFGRYIFGLLQGALFIQIAVWTRGAGQEFERVATTTGADVEHLMAALDQLRRTYGLVLATIVLALTLTLGVLALSLILSSLPTVGRS